MVNIWVSMQVPVQIYHCRGGRGNDKESDIGLM